MPSRAIRSLHNSQQGAAVIVCLMLAFFVRQELLQRGRTAYAAVDAYAMVDVVLTVILAIQVLTQGLWRRIHNVTGDRFLYCAMGYYAYAIVSSLWSSNPAYSLFRAGQVSVFVLSAMSLPVLWSETGGRRCERNVFLFAYALITISVAARIFKGGLHQGLAGFHGLTYSVCASMVFCYCLAELLQLGVPPRRARFLQVNLVLMLAVIALGTSSTATIALSVTSVFMLPSYNLKKSMKVIACMSLCGILLAVWFTQSRVSDIAMMGVMAGKDTKSLETMTGRTQLWEVLIERGKKRPLLGYGFAMGSRGKEVSLNNAHNVLVGTFVDGGIVGLLLFSVLHLGLFVNMLGRVRTTGKRTYTTGALAVLVSGTICSMSVPIIGTWLVVAVYTYASFLMLAYVTPPASLPNPKKRTQAVREAFRNDRQDNQ
jgi:hypothetical protein